MPIIAGQSIAAALDGLYTSLVTLFAGQVGTDGSPVLVSRGEPGQYQPSAIVAIMGTQGEIARPTLGPARSRELAAAITLIISVYTPGDESQQQVSADSAFGLLSVLETNLRVSPNERIGGAARDAWVSHVDVVDSVATQPNPAIGEPPMPTGRVTEITATLTTLIRY